HRADLCRRAEAPQDGVSARRRAGGSIAAPELRSGKGAGADQDPPALMAEAEDGTGPAVTTCLVGHPLGRGWTPRTGCAACRFEDMGDRLAARLKEGLPDLAFSEIRAAVDLATIWSQQRRELLEIGERGLDWLRDG